MRKLVAEDRIAKIFCTLAILLFILLFGLSISSTWVNEWSLADEFLFQEKDSILKNLLGLGAVVIIFLLLYQLGSQFRGKMQGNTVLSMKMDAVALIASGIACLFGFYWVEASNTLPGGDQHAICYFAEGFAAGDYSSLEKGGYLGGYSHQLGLLTFVRILFYFFGVGNFKVFQYFNALMIPVLIFSGYRIVKHLSSDSRAAESFYLLLGLTCVPLYCYVPFVYGEISSTALVLLATWMFLDCYRQYYKIPYGKLGIMSIALGLAVQLRMNTLIFIIAFLIVALMKLVQKVAKQNILMLVAVLLGTILMQGMVDGIYAKLIPEDSHPIPSIMYIAMGVNDDKQNAGWHNNYDVDGFAAYDHDVERATDDALAHLEAFAEKCKQNPGYALDFYYRKISAQWNAPMYQSLAMNNNLGEGQSAFAESVYFGKLRGATDWFMNIYQPVIYGAVLACLILNWKKWGRIENYVLLIAIFGGFLFSILWEAKTRYVFPYFVVMLPYAAVGIYRCIKLSSQKLSKAA